MEHNCGFTDGNQWFRYRAAHFDREWIAMYFVLKPRGTKELESDSYTMGVKETMHRIPVEELDRHRAFPRFMKNYLQSEHTGIEHIITDERV